MNIKLNDVYNFRFSEEYCKKEFEPYWCFDGQLIVKQNNRGELYLEDTYWGDNGDNKVLTLEEALDCGELTLICNLNDIETIRRSELDYYNDRDLFDLSRQHGCYRELYKRKGARKSAYKMEQVLRNKIEQMEYEIRSRERDIEICKQNLEEVTKGNTNIYI